MMVLLELFGAREGFPGGSRLSELLEDLYCSVVEISF